MKLYRFAYNGYGESFSTVAETEEQALAAVVAHLEAQEEIRAHKGNPGYYAAILADVRAYSQEPNEIEGTYVLQVFEPGQVLETERA